MSRLTNKGVDQTGLSSRDAAIDASFYLRCAVTAASATASQLTMHRRPTCHEYQWLVSAQCVGTRQPDTRQMSIVSTRIATRHKNDELARWSLRKDKTGRKDVKMSFVFLRVNWVRDFCAVMSYSGSHAYMDCIPLTVDVCWWPRRRCDCL